MFRRKKVTLVAMILLAMTVLLMACAPANGADMGSDSTATPDLNEPVSSDDPTPTTEPQSGQMVQSENAIIESIRINIMESFPLQVSVTVSGQLRDGCTTIDEITAEREGNTFQIRVFTERPADAICTEALVPLEETVALDVAGLPAGEYVVKAYDLSETFRLDVNNVLNESQACPVPNEGEKLVQRDAFCFLVPDDFNEVAPEDPSVDAIVRGSDYGKTGQNPWSLAELIIGFQQPLEGKDLRAFVVDRVGHQELLSDEQALLGGRNAFVMEGLPEGAQKTRVIVVEHEGQWLFLTFQPVGYKEFSQVLEDQERLCNLVLSSWVWTE